MRNLLIFSIFVSLMASCEKADNENSKKKSVSSRVGNGGVDDKENRSDVLFDAIAEHESLIECAWRDAEQSVMKGESQFTVEGDGYKVNFLRESNTQGEVDKNGVFEIGYLVGGSVQGVMVIRLEHHVVKNVVFHPARMGSQNLKTEVILRE